MSFCSKCGKEINDEAVICVHCGCSVRNQSPTAAAGGAQSGITGWSILGFFIPIVGLIMYLIWNTSEPVKAKAAGKGALIGFITSAVLSILCGVIAVAAVAIDSMLY